MAGRYVLFQLKRSYYRADYNPKGQEIEETDYNFMEFSY